MALMTAMSAVALMIEVCGGFSSCDVRVDPHECDVHFGFITNLWWP